MIEKELLSVIMPAYNRSDTIGKSISSVLGQSYQNWELIIVDDASDDSTREVVMSLKDPRIIYIRNDVQLGANASRNRGIQKANGKIIAFLDSADIWDSKKLDKQLMEMEKSHADIVFCGEYVHSEIDNFIIPNARQIRMLKMDRIEELLALENCIDTSTLLIKRECLKVLGNFREELPRFQEYEWLLRAVVKYKIKYLDEILVHAYIRPDSISSDPIKLLQAVPLIYRDHSSFFSKYNRQLNFLMLPIRELNSRNSFFESYKQYFLILKKCLGNKYKEDIMRLYEETIKFMIEKDYINRFIIENQREGNTFFNLLKKDCKFLLFGMGDVAKKVYSYFKIHGKEKNIESIIVTSLSDNSGEGVYVPIQEVKDCNSKIKQIPIIVAVAASIKYEIVNELQEFGFKDIVCLLDWEWEIIRQGEKALIK